MSVVADVLTHERDAILEDFLGRARSIAPRKELQNRLPGFLAQLADAVRGQPLPPGNAEDHGEQRERLGFDLADLTRAYALLADCIYERLARLPSPPTVTEMQRLATHLSAAVATAVDTYVGAQRDHGAEDRRRLLGLFEQSPGFLAYLHGPTFVFELANPAYYRTVGHRELIGKPVHEALPELAGQGIFELLERVYTSGKAYVGHGLSIHLQRDADHPRQEALVDFVYQPILDDAGAVAGILVQGSEVTAAKLLERENAAAVEALHASEDRLRSLFEAIDDGYCLMQMIVENGKTVDYRFLEANEAFEEHTGLREAIGRTAREMVPDLDASWFERYGRVAETGEPLRFESHAPAMGRWFDVYAHRVGPAERREVALVFKNVSERKKAEIERERLLTLESAARKAAEESSLLKDEFLATVSHELRTPLSAILGWAQLLRTGDLAADKAERAVETIERNARAQSRLIEDLLDVSRILAGKLRLELGPVVADTFVEAAVETVRPAAEKKGIGLDLRIDHDLRVLADASRLQQVVQNLLTNAVKFTPRGGLVQVTAERRDRWLAIVVTDSGQGIPAAFLPHVFERFRQARQGSERSHGGLGLGLSIVRQLVEMHSGTVAAESQGAGKGASFTICIPLAASSAAPLATPPGAAVPSDLAGVHALVVDDDEDNREIVASLLELAGASVSSAASVADAMTKLAAAPFDLVFSDIGMPDEDGYAFVAKIRALAGPVARVPVVAVTAFARPEDRSRALAAGFDAYIAKPVVPGEIVALAAMLTRRPRA